MLLDPDLNARLSAALVKAYGRRPIAWSLSPSDFERVRHQAQLLALPFALGGGDSVLIVEAPGANQPEKIAV